MGGRLRIVKAKETKCLQRVVDWVRAKGVYRRTESGIWGKDIAVSLGYGYTALKGQQCGAAVQRDSAALFRWTQCLDRLLDSGVEVSQQRWTFPNAPAPPGPRPLDSCASWAENASSRR
jgi:hypothetical protein